MATMDSQRANMSQPRVTKTVVNEEKQQTEDGRYILGWRLHIISFAFILALFISLMESSIVSTSVISITNDLGGYDKSYWIFSAYLITNGGMLIIWAKLSDIFGRKPIMTLAILIFTIFSAACGGSQSLVQLIMFRWCQGLGGSGIYAIGTLIFFELVPPKKYPDYTALVTASIALSLVLAPLIGGAITQHGQWRWIFLLNIPVAVISLILLIAFMPQRLQTEPAFLRLGSSGKSGAWGQKTARIDVLGALLLLGGCLLLSTGLEQATANETFASPKILPLLILSGFMWIMFVSWQWFVTQRLSYPEPVLPWRLLKNRVILGMLINTYLTGTIFMVSIVQIPQRFMVVNSKSPFQAGVRLLPFGAMVPFGSVIAAMLMGRARIAPFYILLSAGVFEIIGTVCLSKMAPHPEIAPAQYGYQVLAGLGVGFFNSALVLLVPHVTEKRDLAVGNAAIAQFRLLGGTVGLASATCVMNRYLRPRLLDLLSPENAGRLIQSTAFMGSYSESTQLKVREAFGNGYNLQMTVLIGFAVAQVLATLMMWRKDITTSIKQQG